MQKTVCWLIVLVLSNVGLVRAEAPQPDKTEPSFKRQEDVVYGRKFGTALTLDVFTPTQNANGAAVIFVVSGGWFSSHELVGPSVGFFGEFLKRGYTVFAVVHGSQPLFPIPEIVEDLNRATRFIRYHAKDYHIDPNRIGITGASSGGHLSLMQALGGDLGNPKALDSVDRTSSRIQAVACFFPPTDFLNYGEKDKEALGQNVLSSFRAPFAFRELDPKTKSFVLITDEARRREIGKRISPITHVSAESPPTLIIHGDADSLVPIQQSESLIAKLKEAKVPAQLVVKPGAGHGWPGADKDIKVFADWFDKYLAVTAATPAGDGHSKIDVGLQLYSLRTQLAKDVPGSLVLVPKWEVSDVETAGFYNLSAEQFRQQLDKQHLHASGAHFQWERFSKDIDGVIRDAKVLGCSYVTLPWIPHEGDFTVKEARLAVEKFNQWGRQCADAGLKFTYHAHGYEFRPYENGTLFDLMARETKPEWVNFELDIFWAYDGGADPVKLMKQYPTRFPQMHLKDMSKEVKTPNYTGHENVDNDVALGTGQLELPAILKEAEKIGVQHYYIEDESKASDKQIPQSIRYVHMIGH